MGKFQEMGITCTLRRLEMGKRWGKKERDSDASPARRLWLASSRRSSPPLQAEWGNNQMVATTNHLDQLQEPSWVRAESQGWSEVTERKRERDGRKSREVSRAASSPAAVQVQASGTRDRDLQK